MNLSKTLILSKVKISKPLYKDCCWSEFNWETSKCGYFTEYVCGNVLNPPNKPHYLSRLVRICMALCWEPGSLGLGFRGIFWGNSHLLVLFSWCQTLSSRKVPWIWALIRTFFSAVFYTVFISKRFRDMWWHASVLIISQVFSTQ